MYRRFHDRFGTAGVVIAAIALVLALGGTAVAASGGLSAKQKKEVKAIAKSFQGTGPAGAAGAKGDTGAKGDAGSQGAKGDKGDSGTNGTNGTNGTPGAPGANGKTILSGATAPSNATGTQGDFYINTTSDEIFGPKPSNAGAWGAGTALKGANGTPGADGSPWVVGKAPSGVVMKGTWAIQQYTAAAAGETIPVPISTAVPINPLGGGVLVLKQGENLPGQTTEEREEIEGVCPGSASNPQPSQVVPTFVLCVYVKENTNIVPPSFTGVDLSASGGGAVLNFTSQAAGAAKAYGSWALVTR